MKISVVIYLTFIIKINNNEPLLAYNLDRALTQQTNSCESARVCSAYIIGCRRLRAFLLIPYHEYEPYFK